MTKKNRKEKIYKFEFEYHQKVTGHVLAHSKKEAKLKITNGANENPDFNDFEDYTMWDTPIVEMESLLVDDEN